MKRTTKSGFSFFETLIFVCILSALSLVVIPSYLQYQNRNKAARLADDFRMYASTIVNIVAQAETENSRLSFPDLPGQFEKSIPGLHKGSIIGGQWEWSCYEATNEMEIRLINPKANIALLEQVDHLLDDGNLQTGTFTGDNHHLKMIVAR